MASNSTRWPSVEFSATIRNTSQPNPCASESAQATAQNKRGAGGWGRGGGEKKALKKTLTTAPILQNPSPFHEANDTTTQLISLFPPVSLSVQPVLTAAAEGQRQTSSLSRSRKRPPTPTSPPPPPPKKKKKKRRRKKRRKKEKKTILTPPQLS